MIKEMFKGKIDIEYKSVKEEGHYEITPYAFRPKVAKKFVSNYYHDLGQGILDVIYDVYSELDKNSKIIKTVEKLIESKRDINETN